ncbi:uncharacterized protein ACA1_353220 [Acanthamoeba castellanii str. Neff]|uniref:Uncharacterized protein n=1 Tax=Acanthamoeba castellanii (strain ATCC 30010 / Neff) TaxID=1257118 RepID=L8GG23_ACACF|nr:uncharacterized protein ACA1_353220 [Acanthamoeba castellanii str. Neff]ELR12030.1 hypothetical protein ACA1_353220 [Acanthamoeba castellanii str. Neff]
MKKNTFSLDKLWKGQEETHQLLINLITKVNLQHSMEQDNVTNLVQVEVACVYFDIVKVKQGDGNKLQLEFIKWVEEKEKVKLLASVKNWISKSFVPVPVTKSLKLLLTHAFEKLKPAKKPAEFKVKVAVDKQFRDTLIQTAFRMVNEWVFEDPLRPPTEPGHSK